MSSDINFVRRRKRSRPSPVLAAICFAAVLSLGVAAVWQTFSPGKDEEEPFVFDPAIAAQYYNSDVPQGDVSLPGEESQTGQLPSSDASSSKSSASSESVSPVQASFYALVPEMEERVRSTYFDDAVFIGDSITTGISLYDVMSNAEVYASTGVGISNVLTKEIATVDGVDMSVPEALKKTQPGKIYILLGANSLAGNFDDVVGEYSRILDIIHDCAPNALIYVQSVFPINEAIYSQKYNSTITNEVIRAFNERLLELCCDKEFYFLDLYSFFADENGELSSEFTADGLHIFSAKYLDWFDYLKTHAVTDNK